MHERAIRQLDMAARIYEANLSGRVAMQEKVNEEEAARELRKSIRVLEMAQVEHGLEAERA